FFRAESRITESRRRGKGGARRQRRRRLRTTQVARQSHHRQPANDQQRFETGVDDLHAPNTITSHLTFTIEILAQSSKRMLTGGSCGPAASPGRAAAEPEMRTRLTPVPAPGR